MKAIAVYREALVMFPQFPEAHQNIGHLYDTQNDLLSARKHHDLSVKYASSAQFNASAIVNLVLVERKLQPLQSLPQLQKLSSLLDDAEALEPNNVNVIFTHALILEYMGEISLCTAKLKRVITLDDRHPLAWLNLGNQWFRANDFDVAAKFYKNALERLPIEDVYNRVLVLNNLGQCYRERGHLRLAYEAFHDALKAIQSTSTTASTDGSPIATPELHHVNEKITAGIDYSGGRYDGKAVHFWCINNLYTIQGMLCDWRGFESLEEQIQKFIYAPEERSTNNNSGDVGKYQLSSFSAEGVQLDAYTMSLLRYASQATDKYVCQQSCLVQPLYSEHTDLATQQQQSAGGGVDSVPPRSAAGVPSPVTKRTLQVAYLSHDWRDHPMGRLTATLVTGHHQDSAILSTYHSKSRYAPNVPMSKQGSFPHRINATAVSYGANDKSNIREYVERHANAFVDILKVPNDMEAAEMLHQRNFDVVVDITGHTYNGRIEIAALRPAPIIINYLGFPGTTGCTGFDYSMVQSTIVPPEIAGSLFTERMLYLPYTYQVNDMLLRVAPEDLVRGDATSVRGKLVRSKFESSVGDEADVAGQRENSDVPVVPVNSLLLCSFNANKKMEPVSFLSWMNILHRVPSAVLVLLSVSSDTKANIFQELSYYGIVHRRVVFIPKRNWRRHLMRSAECDLVLDTFVYGAHTTASDVLWMGAPLLSLAAFGSQRMPSRVAASITQALSVPSNCVDAHSSPVEPAHILVVDSIRQYEDTAVRYLRSIRSVRTALTRSILHRAVRGAAFDSELMQKTVEFAYQAAHEARSVTRATPSHIPVLPHIFIPDFFSASQSAHVDKSAFSCGASWIKKFQRDLQQCCELSHDEINHLFADLKSLGQVREGGFATSSHSGQGISEILTGCQQRILAASDEKQVCGGTDHQALLRRIKWLYPALSVTTEAAMVPIVANVATIFKPATTQVSQQEYSAPAEIFDCTAELTLQIATQLFVELSDDADRSKGRFLRALQYCFEDSAPIVVDFLLSVHNTFQDRSLCAAEVAFFEFTQPVFFTSDNQVVSDSERASGAQLLKRLSSVTTYLSPLWRSLPAFDLRNIVLNHLLPLHLRHLRSPGGRSVTQRVYEDHLRMYLPRVAAVFPVTVCSKFLTEHGVVLSAEAESAHCMGFLSQQLAVILSGHSICLSQLAGRQLSDGDLAAALPFTLAASQRAVLDMVAAFKLDPTDQRLLNLGTVLMDAQMSEIGYFLSSVAALRRLKALPPIEYVTTGSSVPISLAAEMAESATLADDLSPKPRIVFYCDEYGQGWWKGEIDILNNYDNYLSYL